MTTLLLFIAVIYGALVLYMAVYQRRLMYYPNPHIESPAYYQLSGFEDLRTKSKDGGSVQLWHKPAQPGFPTVIHFHGNAGNIGDRAMIYHALTETGFGLLGVSYRGYGKSEGSPTEMGIYNDARAALDYLADTLKIPPSRTLLYGESLGSGVAVQMATEYAVAGLILEAPYTSVANRAAEIYYYIPVKLLIRDHFDSLGKIARVNAPVMVFQGELDQVIPPSHARRLLEAVTGTKKSFFFPHVGHNDFDSRVISSHVLDFAREHQLITQ